MVVRTSRRLPHRIHRGADAETIDCNPGFRVLTAACCRIAAAINIAIQGLRRRKAFAAGSD